MNSAEKEREVVLAETLPSGETTQPKVADPAPQDPLDIIGILRPMKLMTTKNGREYVLLEDYTVVLEEEVITVPKGFITDLASVPRILWHRFPPFGKYTHAAVVHDFLCRSPGYSRTRADRVFLVLMKYLGVSFYTRYLFYLGVRIGSGFAK